MKFLLVASLATFASAMKAPRAGAALALRGGGQIGDIDEKTSRCRVATSSTFG